MSLVLLILGYAAFSRAQGGGCTHSPQEFHCVQYVRNYDADTLTVRIPGVHPLLGHDISVRVLGIDSPEIKGRAPCEKETARNGQRLVENLLKNAHSIELKKIQRDKYFRILAEVWVDGKELGALLLKNRLAVEYSGGTKRSLNWCEWTNRKPATQ
jgi:endonuclease YncB( thermonuclease family)